MKNSKKIQIKIPVLLGIFMLFFWMYFFEFLFHFFDNQLCSTRIIYDLPLEKYFVSFFSWTLVDGSKEGSISIVVHVSSRCILEPTFTIPIFSDCSTIFPTIIFCVLYWFVYFSFLFPSSKNSFINMYQEKSSYCCDDFKTDFFYCFRWLYSSETFYSECTDFFS